MPTSSREVQNKRRVPVVWRDREEDPISVHRAQAEQAVPSLHADLWDGERLVSNICFKCCVFLQIAENAKHMFVGLPMGALGPLLEPSGSLRVVILASEKQRPRFATSKTRPALLGLTGGSSGLLREPLWSLLGIIFKKYKVLDFDMSDKTSYHSRKRSIPQ